MRLGISYNVFDGEELLEGSIRCIRPEVDFISVVFQTVSNFNQECSPELLPLLERLQSEGLIDQLVQYTPQMEMGGHYNELYKRNIGLFLSNQNGCTHHMSMDTDEYYILDQFKYLKNKVIENDLDSTYCQMKTYYKSWEYQLDPPEDYYVSLIFKIEPNQFYTFGGPSPVLIDPTRRIKIGNHKIFSREEIEMHHGSYVRNNLETKLINSNIPNEYKTYSSKIVDHYNNWEYPNDILWMAYPPQYKKVKKIDKLFS